MKAPKNLQEVSGGRPDKDAPVPGYYVPGHALQKIAMIAFGLAVFAFGMSQLWMPLRLFFVGGRATAEATRVIKTRLGLPDIIMTDDREVRAKQESHDRSCIFWNEFGFQTANGSDVIVRLPVGSVHKPLYSIFDDNGLPTHARVWYDPVRHGLVIFPEVFSTWFAPGVLAVLGVVCAITGVFLFYWAGKPIELPDVSDVAEILE